MSLDLIKQNAQSVMELANNRENLMKEKDALLKKIYEFRKINDKNNLDLSIKKLENINLQLEQIKTYLIKVIISNYKIIQEEKASLK